MHVPRLLDRLDGPTPPWTTWLIMAVGMLLVALVFGNGGCAAELTTRRAGKTTSQD